MTILVSCSKGPNGQDRVLHHPVVIGHEAELNTGAEPPPGPDSVRFRESPPGNDNIGALRHDALKNAAHAYGSQHGFRRRVWEINELLGEHAPVAGRLFDFNRVVSHLPDNVGVVIPPVMKTTTDNTHMSDNSGQLAISDRNITMIRPGRLAVTVPTIFDYLTIPVEEPVIPGNGLLPRGSEEASLYSKWFNEGWHAGRQLARDEFATRLQRLLDDYDGMLEYRKLVASGIMTKIVLSQSEFGTTVHDDTMRIGDRVVQVELEAGFRDSRAIAQTD